MRKSLVALVAAAALVTVVGGFVVNRRHRELRMVATGAELRRAATAAIHVAGGKWATLGPVAGGTWKATVVREDHSTAVVILNDRLQIIRVIGPRPVPRKPARGRNLAVAQPRAAALNL
jgi:hypothetical protein